MTGSPSAPGFLPRALEMIFSSIEGRQTKEFQVQPDDKNGFRLLNDTEMMTYRLEKRNDLVSSRLGSKFKAKKTINTSIIMIFFNIGPCSSLVTYV